MPCGPVSALELFKFARRFIQFEKGRRRPCRSEEKVSEAPDLQRVIGGAGLC
jgi:hypothetical protein